MQNESIKIVGNRKIKPHPNWKEADNWLKTVAKLRGNRGVCKRGVYLFKSFEEAHEWKMNMLIKSSLETQQ